MPQLLGQPLGLISCVFKSSLRLNCRLLTKTARYQQALLPRIFTSSLYHVRVIDKSRILRCEQPDLFPEVVFV